LSARQRALVEQLQRATDAYALRRFAQVDLLHQLLPAKDALAQARVAERTAVGNEVLGLAEAGLAQTDTPRATTRRKRAAVLDRRLDAFHDERRALDSDRREAKQARVRAQATVADLQARLDAQTKSVQDTLADRADAESGIEGELGSDAVRARPDGITATLLATQSGQADPIVVGGLESPVPGAALASPFGLRNDPMGGGAGFHPGMDLSATSGTEIHASAAGVVVTAGDCGGYGNCVVIDHGTSVATLYGHQSQVLVSVGMHVDAGQVIGLVGSTGLSTGPHLHFEVRLHGLPIDPLLALTPV
jgi:murein DD-endopeptidase MepM/ murein hydrolase activator NlpD